MTRPPEHAEESDERLIARIMAGDQTAMLALHRRYVHLVYSLALRVVGEPMAAEEVTQDTFLKVWERAEQFQQERGRFSSWLLTITRNLAIDELRRSGRRPNEIEPAGDGESEQETWDTFASSAHEVMLLNQQVRLAMGNLPEAQRQLIELAFFGGMTHEEISAHLNIPLGTVKTRIRLGLQKLKAIWQS